MRRFLPLALATLLLAACGEDDGALETTTTEATTSSTSEPTTTSEATTTSAPETTTSTEATTTTAEATTTTEPGPASLVTGAFATLGGWDGSGWYQLEAFVDDPASIDAEAGEVFTLVRTDGSTQDVTATGVDLVCEPLGTFGVQTDPELGYSDIAVRAPWELQPRLPLTSPEVPSEIQETADAFATDQDLATPVHVSQWFVVDLEGDGEDETFVLGESRPLDDFAVGEEGDYSFLLALDAEGATTVINRFETVPFDGESGPGFLTRALVAAFADLDGNGDLEVVVEDQYYEGGGHTVWDGPSASDLFVVMTGGCGA